MTPPKAPGKSIIDITAPKPDIITGTTGMYPYHKYTQAIHLRVQIEKKNFIWRFNNCRKKTSSSVSTTVGVATSLVIIFAMFDSDVSDLLTAMMMVSDLGCFGATCHMFYADALHVLKKAKAYGLTKTYS